MTSDLRGDVRVLRQGLHHAAHVGSGEHVLHQLRVLRDLLHQALHAGAVEYTWNGKGDQ